MSKETDSGRRASFEAKETCFSGKRDLFLWQNNSLSLWQTRPVSLAKETCFRRKRDLFPSQKRSNSLAKETSFCGKSHLSLWQKRPTSMAKETYTMAKETCSCTLPFEHCPLFPHPLPPSLPPSLVYASHHLHINVTSSLRTYITSSTRKCHIITNLRSTRCSAVAAVAVVREHIL